MMGRNILRSCQSYGLIGLSLWGCLFERRLIHWELISFCFGKVRGKFTKSSIFFMVKSPIR